MFARLLKHEFKSTYRQFLIAYGLLILMGLLIGVCFKLDFNITMIIIIALLAYGTLIASLVLFGIYSMRILNQNTYQKRGYLTFSLPINTHALLISKIVAILIYLLGLGISVFIAIGLIILFIDPSILGNLFSSIIPYYTNPIFALISFLIGFVSSVMAIVVLQFIFAFTNSGLSRRHRVLVQVLLVIGLYVLLNILFVFDPIGYYLGCTSEGTLQIFSNEEYSNLLTDGRTIFTTINIFRAIITIFTMVGLYFLTVYIIDHKLELE